MSKKLVATVSVAGVIGGIAFTIFLTQTLLAPIIEKANWFPENGALGIACWLLLYVVLALLAALLVYTNLCLEFYLGFGGDGQLHLLELVWEQFFHSGSPSNIFTLGSKNECKINQHYER